MFTAILGGALIATGFVISWSIYVSRICTIHKKDQATLLGVIAGVFLLGSLAVTPAAYGITHHIVQRDAVGGYHQWLNGSIVSADSQRFRCSKDGPCSHEYACDYYTVEVPYTVTDSKGNSHTEWRTETRHHDCPYVTDEYSYSLTVSFGFKTETFDLASHIFAAQPQAWKRGKSIPGDVARGAPPQWQHAHDAIQAGNTDPATITAKYDNYLLSSESTILKAHSDDIAQLKKLKLLPDPSQNLKEPIYDNYMSDKTVFVGFNPPNGPAWQSSLMHFNAALGIEKQGDLHIVAIKASALPASISSEDYLNAVKADWLNNLGKYAIAKNSIILILGVDDAGSTIQWSRATTGMPVGNGAMLQALGNDLAGLPFSPDAILGNTTGRVVNPTSKHPVSYQIGSGRAAQIIMVEYPFERACMGCTDKSEQGKQSFVYLSTEIPVGGWALFWMFVVDTIIIGGMSYFAFGAYAGGLEMKGYDTPRYNYPTYSFNA
jgi:hypothetical protein